MSNKKLIIATPHRRNDNIIINVSEKLNDCELIRIRSKQELNLENLTLIKPDIIFFPHWSWIIPNEIHQKFKCIIFHMTDLPYGRGGSPLQNLIVQGHKETMLSALRCVAELDAGPIYLKRQLSLQGTAEEILVRASAIIEDMLVEIAQNEITPLPQQGEVVHFQRRKPEDGNISKLNDLGKVHDFIRMLDADGYPPAFIDTECFHVEFRGANFTGEEILANVKITRKQ